MMASLAELLGLAGDFADVRGGLPGAPLEGVPRPVEEEYMMAV